MLKKGAIVGIAIVIAFLVVLGSQYGSVSEDTSQEDTKITEFEKIEKIQKQTITSEKPTLEKVTTQSNILVQSILSKDCSGNARCFSGTETKIIDGDTIHVDGQSIRFALASAPEINTSMGLAAKQYIQQICPVGSKVKVDEDDGQTQGSYGRIVGVIYCNGVNLNQAVLGQGFGHFAFSKTFCDNNEFSGQPWSECYSNQKETSSQTQYTQPDYSQTTESNCDPNYSGCIPPYPPDLDCSDVGKNIRVIDSDPHGFDRDGDGIGCE